MRNSTRGDCARCGARDVWTYPRHVERVWKYLCRDCVRGRSDGLAEWLHDALCGPGSTDCPGHAEQVAQVRRLVALPQLASLGDAMARAATDYAENGSDLDRRVLWDSIEAWRQSW